MLKDTQTIIQNSVLNNNKKIQKDKASPFLWLAKLPDGKHDVIKRSEADRGECR